MEWKWIFKIIKQDGSSKVIGANSERQAKRLRQRIGLDKTVKIYPLINLNKSQHLPIAIIGNVKIIRKGDS